MKYIAIMDQMEDAVVEKLKQLGEVSLNPDQEFKQKANIMIVRSKTKVNLNLLEEYKNLKLVIRGGVGIDNIDCIECQRKNIIVKNTPNASTRAVAEITIGAMLCLMRNIGFGHLQIKQGVWAKKQCKGNELYGKTLGIIGFGRIAKMVKEYADCFGVKTIAYDPRKKEDFMIPLETLFKQSDIISLHARLTEETKNMINKESIEKMKQDVFIINFARGEMVNEDDIYEALKNKRIKGLAMDVFSQEPYDGKLKELDNVLLTPHIGASSVEAQMRIGEEIYNIISEFEI